MAIATKTIRVKFRPDNGRIIGTPLNQWKIAFVAKKYRGRVCMIHEQTCVVCHETVPGHESKGCFIVWPPLKCEQCEHEETYAMCVRLLDRAITKLLLFVGPPAEPLPEIDPFVAGSVAERGNAISQWLSPYEALADKSPLALDILEQMGNQLFTYQFEDLITKERHQLRVLIPSEAKDAKAWYARSKDDTLIS